MIVKLQKLPKEFSKLRKEPNLLSYKDFQILVLVEKGKIVGSVRLGLSVDNSQEGIVTDLYYQGESLTIGTQGQSLQGWYAQLLKEAESILKKKGVRKIDAYYLDGPGKLEHFYKAGYVPERRTVEILWDLKGLRVKREGESGDIKIKETTKKVELEELFEDSLQPYWIAPRDFSGKTFFVAYDGEKAIGMVDANLEIGVVIRKGYGGEGLGTGLLRRVLDNLKRKGKEKVTTLATSGLDDYDPQIYLYTMNGGKIVREYICLLKDQ